MPDPQHAVVQSDTVTTFYPQHPPRVETDVYVKSHKLLTVAQNKPCWACGITHADIVGKTTPNIPPGLAMETHHFWAEYAFTGAGGTGLGGIYWARVMADHPLFDWANGGFVLDDPQTWKHFVDSPFNLQVLCSSCHRAAKPVRHWLAGMPDPARGNIVWPPNSGSVGIHHATYPEYRDQRHNRPDTPPFHVPDAQPLIKVPPHVLLAEVAA